MTLSPTPLADAAAAPELARRLGVILVALAAVIARRFLRMPAYAGLIIPLWRRLTHAEAKFVRGMARPVVVRAPRVAPVRAERVRAERVRAERVAGVRLPSRQGWLVEVLGYEAAASRSQLEALLAEPGMRAALDAAPGVGRILRPLCRMLGLPVALARAASDPPAPESRPWPPVIKPVVPATRWPWQDFRATADDPDAGATIMRRYRPDR